MRLYVIHLRAQVNYFVALLPDLSLEVSQLQLNAVEDTEVVFLLLDLIYGGDQEDTVSLQVGADLCLKLCEGFLIIYASI